MLSKCANPGCSTPFLYLHEGKLFRMEIEAGDDDGANFGADPEIRKSSRQIEFFWLCDRCAAEMTLTFKKGVGVMTRPLVPGRTAPSSWLRSA
jgi:hypothetical protein